MVQDALHLSLIQISLKSHGDSGDTESSDQKKEKKGVQPPPP